MRCFDQSIAEGSIRRTLRLFLCRYGRELQDGRNANLSAGKVLFAKEAPGLIQKQRQRMRRRTCIFLSEENKSM